MYTNEPARSAEAVVARHLSTHTCCSNLFRSPSGVQSLPRRFWRLARNGRPRLPPASHGPTTTTFDHATADGLVGDHYVRLLWGCPRSTLDVRPKQGRFSLGLDHATLDVRPCTPTCATIRRFYVRPGTFTFDSHTILRATRCLDLGPSDDFLRATRHLGLRPSDDCTFDQAP